MQHDLTKLKALLDRCMAFEASCKASPSEASYILALIKEFNKVGQPYGRSLSPTICNKATAIRLAQHLIQSIEQGD